MEYKLPPLPEPHTSDTEEVGTSHAGDPEYSDVFLFSSDQMQAYAIAAIEAQASEVQQSENDAAKLATAIAEAATRAGITDSDKHSFSGPQLLMLLDDMVDMAKQASEVQQEPLGFMNAGHVYELQQKRIPYGYLYPEEGTGAHVAVYTRPAQQAKPQPLSDEQMWKLWNAQGSDDMNQKEAIAFARAIEAAHGIQGS